MALLYPDGDTFLRMLLRDPSVAAPLACMRTYHSDTARHEIRVARIALDLGVENRLTMQELLYLGKAALRHDDGKRKTPIAILCKRGPLDEWERGVMDDHPRKGFLLAADEPEEVQGVIVSHHEWQPNAYPRRGHDRRTYPRDSERRQYSRLVRDLTEIVAAADLYDALSQARAYKPALPREKVEQFMHEQYLGDRLILGQVLKRAA